MTDPAARGPGGAAPESRPPESGRSQYARPLAQPANVAPAPGPLARMPAGRDRVATTPDHRRQALATVAHISGPPVAVAAIATAVLVAVAAVLAGSRSVAINVWLLTIGGLALWTFWRALARALPTAASSAFDTVRDRTVEPPSSLYDVIAIEGALLDAEWSRGGAEHRLRPLIRRIASARLIEHHQVDLATEPAEARRILGEELWALVGPDEHPGPGHASVAALPVAGPAEILPSPTDTPLATEWTYSHHGRRGMPRADIRRAIDLLEAL